MFKGISTLRAQEAKVATEPTEKAKALHAYLQKYQTGDQASEGPAKKKRKKVKAAAAAANGIRIVDQDTSGFAAAAVIHSDDEGQKNSHEQAFSTPAAPKGP